MKRAGGVVRGRPDSGEALVEFALILPIMLVLSLGMLDFGRAFHMKGLVDQAAREGCRVAIVTRPLDIALIEGRVETILNADGIKPNSITVTPGADRLVEVKVDVTFKFMTPGVFSLIGAKFDNSLNLVGKATMRSETGN